MPDGVVKIRERQRDSGTSWNKRYTRSSKKAAWVLASESDMTLKGTQITESEGHPFQGNYGKSDVGGDFTTGKLDAAGYSGNTITCISSDELEKYSGSLRHPNAPSGVTALGQEKLLIPKPGFASANSDIMEKGATAVALCQPANPLSELTALLAEVFREGLVKLPGVQTWKGRSKTELRKRLSGEYLNVTFAALPLLKEIGEVADLISHFSKLCKQYKRDEGRLVRRQFHFDVEESSVEHSLSSNVPIRVGPTALNALSNSGTAVRVDTFEKETISRKCWFSGAFRYHIPDSIIGNIIGAATGASEYNQNLLGNSLTPEILWELAPWSWAIDYFSNAQQVIKNLAEMELYGLFMAYGYVMDEITITKANTAKSLGGSVVCPTYTVTEVTKIRRKANPYGFGIDWGDLSPLQLANLVAAGITRL